MCRRFLKLITFLAFAFPLFSQTTPTDNSQEAAVIEKIATHRHFENDGTSTEEVSAVIRVQSEAGVQQYGQLVVGYSSATEKLTIDYVRVRKPGGEVVDTPEANAQDFAPEIFESAPMYSDFRQRHITVVGLRPGDTLEYHTTTKTFQPLAAGQFWSEYSFPKGIAVSEARLDIDVPKSRELHLKSPKQKYTTTDAGDVRTYSWAVKNIAPDRTKKKIEDLKSESEDQSPDIQLTTFKDWQEVASWYAKLQGERVVVNDAIQKKAGELTRGATTPKEKAQRLYDFVAQDIRYVSLSFGVGRLQPHAAADVLMGSYGDCKDKHTLLAALLRAAGIQSYPVMIGSERKIDEDVPSPAQFDHVITAARIDRELTFLDATAEVAPFGLILYQLRDKQALIAADAPTGGLHKTPAAVPVKNSISFDMDGTFSESGAMDAAVDMALTGDSALPLRVYFRSASQADWPRVVEAFARLQGMQGDITKVNVLGLEDAYSALHVKYAIHRDSYFTVPSESDTFYPFPQTGIAQIARSKPGTTIDVGPAIEVHNKTHMQFASNYSLRLPPETRISREYGEFYAKYQATKNVLDAEETFSLKVDKVPSNRRSDVDSVRSVAMNTAAQAVFCTIVHASSGGEAPSVSASSSPQDLHKAAASSLQRSDFQSAAELLRRVVQLEPSDPDAWDELGRAYAGMGDHTSAITAFQKQVEVNAANHRVYDDLGAELQRQGKYEDAIAAYAKQLDQNPADHLARKNHALALAQLKRNKEALSELETLAAAPPQDLDVELALARLYGSTGDNEKSKVLLESVIGNPTIPSNGDLYAAALRDDMDVDANLRNAREILGDIANQFEDGAYKDDPEAALPAMQFVALQWARVGWADILKQQQIEGVRYLESAWKLGQSGTVANRLARIYERGGDPSDARHLLSLAVAAGGADVEDSRTRLAKLSAGSSRAESSGDRDLAQARSVKINGFRGKSGEAEFLLIFDGTSSPDRVEFREGNADLRKAEDSLLKTEYPVSFPDASSLKIVRRGTLSCQSSGCVLTLKQLEPINVSGVDHPSAPSAQQVTAAK